MLHNKNKQQQRACQKKISWHVWKKKNQQREKASILILACQKKKKKKLVPKEKKKKKIFFTLKVSYYPLKAACTN